MRLKYFLPLLAVTVALAACAPSKKEITVVIRERGSGTREAFDRTVTDGIHYLEEIGADGKKIDRNSVYAIVQTKGGSMLSSVAADPYAIGYLSPSTANGQVRILSINGVFPVDESVLDGSYPLSRPFVIFTNKSTVPTPLCADFLRYLKSERMEEHAKEASCVFAKDITQRAENAGNTVFVKAFSPLESLPEGDKLVIRGSTSLEKLITGAAKGYAACYGADASRLFDIQLEGSSIGVKALLADQTGAMIGLSSAAVLNSGLDAFTVAYDALAVIVHPENSLQNLSLSQLFSIFSGKIKYFDELEAMT